MKLLAIITAILFSGSLSLANEEFYSRYEIEAPVAGDMVCQAYVGEFALMGLEANVSLNGYQIAVLPHKLCRRGKDLEGGLMNMGGEKMRVVALGDFYIIPKEPKAASRPIPNPNLTAVVCYAYVRDELDKPKTLYNLDERLCVSGTRIVFLEDGQTRVGTVEATDNYHMVHAKDVLVAELIPEDRMISEPAEGEKEGVVPSSYEIEI